MPEGTDQPGQQPPASQYLLTGYRYRLRVSTEKCRIDHTFVDGAGNPCAFRRFTLQYEHGGPEVKGFTDEEGRVLIEPAPAGRYQVQLEPATVEQSPPADEGADSLFDALFERLDQNAPALPFWR